MAPVQAQRTLVKSPPELWAEVSDVETLARRLGEFGEIRITRLEAERTVAWEGERARGTVELEPSGWGTKVTLTAEEDGPVETEAEPAAPVAVAGATVASEPPEPAPPAEPDPAAPPRGRWWKRLFAQRAADGGPPAPAHVEEPAAALQTDPEPEPEAVSEREPEPEPQREPPSRTEAVLAEALDDLGAAHHRPFSRG